jgi:transcription antitermination factor NusA-like protein
VPICLFDAKNSVLCPQCESKLEAGHLTQADVDASMKLANLAKAIPEIEKFSMNSCRQIGLNHILYLSRHDIDTTRKSRTLYRAISGEFSGKVWLVESEASDRKFIEDLFFPAKLLSINAVWAPGGLQKTKVIVSGKWTSRFPIDTEQVAKIVKELRQLDIVIEFEEKK